ncbi:MAG: LysR family transcriptional regulator [Dethiobacter sp.]|jgi:DNA-binding transcriptional LysR family regulator|nr:MAG: LysR family transcriptional regulator [Dethiobacter sp.]
MDFHQLRVFIEVARQKSFSRAAENIFLSQPTISAHIKTLENEVGTPLLDRSQRELQLTEAGKILFQYAQELLEIKEEALSAIQNEYKIVKGHLEIAASSVPGAYLLPGLLKSFRREYPGVTFSVLLRDTKQVLQSIKDYTYDLGFTGEPGTQEGLGQVKLTEDNLILIAPRETKLPVTGETGLQFPTVELKACLNFPFILREPGSATRKVFEKALKKHFKNNIALNVIGYLESQEALKEAVKAGLGLTVISRKAVEEELRTGVLDGYELQDLPLKRNFYLIFRKKRILPPLSQAFLRFTVKYFNPGEIQIIKQ